VADFDLFANQLLEEAKRFFEKATESTDSMSRAAHLHAALMLAFCALEAHVQLHRRRIAKSTDLSAHEKGSYWSET